MQELNEHEKEMKMILTTGITALLLTACTIGESQEKNKQEESTTENYWHLGKAEITSYTLSQARYGELREGSAVLIFVTEPFSTKTMTKADNPGSEDESVLKLNFTKKFNTGIYPYSMMTSSFFPYNQGMYSKKISSSSQEWCGHTFMDLKNRNQFEVNINSYFQGENAKFMMERSLLEDDVWSMIRLRNNELPMGKGEMIPAFFYLRLAHKETKPYRCEFNLEKGEETSVYTIEYPRLDRSLSIEFENNYPHKIVGWEETYMSGFGDQAKKLTTTAKLKERMMVDYWNKNSNADEDLRRELGLD